MTTASPVPPLAEHTGGNNSYHLRRKRQKALSPTSTGGSDGKENEKHRDSGGGAANGRKSRQIRSAGCGRREIYKCSKADIQFPIPPCSAGAGPSGGSPRKNRSRGSAAAAARRSRSATASLFHLESRAGAHAGPPQGDAGDFFGSSLRGPSWSEDLTPPGAAHGHPPPHPGPATGSWVNGLNGSGGGVTGSGLNGMSGMNGSGLQGVPAYGTPTLALRERVGLLEKEKEELLYRLQQYEEELLARNEEVGALRGRVGTLEEEARAREAEAEAREEERQRQEEEARALRQQLEEEEAAARQREEAGKCEGCGALTAELAYAKQSFEIMQQEYQKLEFAYEESESLKTEYEKRCHFLLLDSDNDGLIQLPELATHEVLLPYAPELLEVCFTNWNYQSGVRNLMCWDDFSLFFNYVEDKNNRKSQNYWFNVLDIDGDGYIGRGDIKWLYDKVDKSEHGCIEFEDLLCQLLDMAQPADSARGFTLAELRKSKLSTGIIGILTNHNQMLLRRSTSEFSTNNRSPDLPL